MNLSLPLLILYLFLTGCSTIIEKQTASFSDSLTKTMLNFEDPKTVDEAMPTFIILLDSFARAPDASPKVKLAAGQLLSAYSGAFVVEEKRARTLATLAYNYTKQGACLTDKKWCNVDTLSTKAFEKFVSNLKPREINILYPYATTWLGYINTHSDDWNAIANLQHCKMLLERSVEFDESYDNAGGHLYLGAIASALPAALGGKPDIAKQHFERAIELTEGKSLLVKVEYARRYARETFNKALHHQLLTEVTKADPVVPDLTLMNTWAQQQAETLLASENDYFF